MTINFTIKVKMQFSSGESVVIRERHIIKKIPLLVNYIARKFPNWEIQNVRINEPLMVPFPQEAGLFLLEYIDEYIPPSKREGPTTLEHYAEADSRTLVELKTLQSLAEFLQCADFRECILFVRSQYFGETRIPRAFIEDYMAGRLSHLIQPVPLPLPR